MTEPRRAVRLVLSFASAATVCIASLSPALADEWSDPETAGAPAGEADERPAAASSSGDRWAVLKTPFSGNRPDVFDVHGGISYYGLGFGVGARYTLQIVDNGFIPKLNNSFGIGFGADVLVHPAVGYYATFGLSFIVPVVVQWAFYLTEKWTVFAEVGAGLWIRPLGLDRDFCNAGLGNVVSCSYVWWVWISGVGALYHFSPSMSLILRAQFPFVSAGIAF